ncbi:MAG: zinc-dependent peptidase [Flavobacterium sp.]|nr:zinc-dependent peptidase [Flavobacterium sp.]
MEEFLYGAMMLVLVMFCLVSVSLFLFNFLIEPAFVMAFKRPMFVHFYTKLRELTPRQKSNLQAEFAFYRRLSDKRKRYFEHRVWVFLAYYKFYGKEGLVVTDEMRIIIAGTYVMMTFGMRHYLTDAFTTILLYPDAYYSTINKVMHHGEFNPRARVIVFSWNHFLDGHSTSTNNSNLGIHEFAHALHHQGLRKRDSSAAMFVDGCNTILKEAKYPPNAQRLITSGYFRSYAFNNDYEFLAVILEHFFETPSEFHREFPILYDHVRTMLNYKTQ